MAKPKRGDNNTDQINLQKLKDYCKDHNIALIGISELNPLFRQTTQYNHKGLTTVLIENLKSNKLGIFLPRDNKMFYMPEDIINKYHLGQGSMIKLY